MPLIKTNTGPFIVNYIGHENAAAFDLEAGSVNACVETADLAIAWRDTHPTFHRVFVPILEELSDIPRGVNQKATTDKLSYAKDKTKVKPVPENFVVYANRVKALLLQQEDGANRWAEIEERALLESAKIRIDASTRQRIAAPDPKDLAKAQSWIEAGDWDFIEERITIYSNYLNGYEVDRDEQGHPRAESLARLITKFLDKKKDQTLLND